MDTYIIEVLLRYLSMADVAIYKIKELSKTKKNDEQIVDTFSLKNIIILIQKI